MFDAVYTEREELECMIYEGHKDAFGTKGRHYDFGAMSIEDLRKEADWIQVCITKACEDEAQYEAESLVKLNAEIDDVIALGAGDRETALRWMTQDETFYHSQDVEGWVYGRGILFTDEGRKLVEELVDIVTFTEAV